jgi:muramidase (phage lysozyme)
LADLLVHDMFSCATKSGEHPNISVQVNPTTKSTAAGAYQFNNPTWNEQSSKLNLQDFSPHSQDLAAVNLLRELGAIPKLLSGDIDGAIFSAAQRWDSLPIDNRGVSKWGSKAPLDRFKNNYYGHLY